jgi:hypothetical protein
MGSIFQFPRFIKKWNASIYLNYKLIIQTSLNKALLLRDNN